MSHERAAHQRHRAAHLRTLARHIGHTASMHLQDHATVDTWYGPRAEECGRDLAAAQRVVHIAIDDLHDRAWRLDRHAEELDAAALAADLRCGGHSAAPTQ